jgi:EpsI family protein
MEKYKTNYTAGLFLSVIILVLLIYYTTAWTIWREWLHSDAYSHGLLLLPVCILLVYLYWKKHGVKIKPALCLTAIVLAGLTSLTWFAASLGNVQVIQQVALVGLIILTPWALFGYRQARGIIPLLALMILAIPVWDFLGVYLQLITASAVNMLLNLFGITSIREGLHILVPAGQFEVAGACSGLRQFIISIIIATLFIFRYRVRPIPGLIFILLSMVIAIFVNITRVYIVVLIGEATQMQHPLVHDHATLGWILFGVVIFIWVFFSANYILNHSALIQTNSVKVSDPAYGNDPIMRSWKDWLKVTLLIIAIAIGPVLFAHYSNGSSKQDNITLSLPKHLDNFEKIPFDSHLWKPVIHGADSSYSATYLNQSSSPVDILIYRYNYQQQGKEAINIDNHLYQLGAWNFLRQKFHTVSLKNNNIVVEETEIQDRAGHQRLIYRWYRTFNRDVANRYYAKGLNIAGIISGDPSITIVILSTPIDSDRTTAEHRLSLFASSVQTLLESSGY